MRRCWVTFIWLSTAAAILLSILVFSMRMRGDWEYRLVSVGSTFHLALTTFGQDWLPRFAFYSDLDYGPYRGSIISLAPLTSTPQFHFGDTLGIYVRYWRFPTGAFWTVAVSAWYPIAVLVAVPAVALTRRLCQRGRSTSKCPKCGYDLRASSGECPECGYQVRG